MPMYRRWKGNIWKMLAGMYIYDALSYDKKDTWDKSKRLQNHRLISYRKTIRLEPNLRKDDLRNAFYFFDYQSIFPERLTLAFIKSAAEYGARVSNYTPVEGFVFGDGNRITGVKVRDTFTGTTREVKGELIINCGGTWADKILNLWQELLCPQGQTVRGHSHYHQKDCRSSRGITSDGNGWPHDDNAMA